MNRLVVERLKLLDQARSTAAITAGLASALALAGAAGIDVPADIRLFGIVIREPREFRESLSTELEARLPEIVREIARHA